MSKPALLFSAYLTILAVFLVIGQQYFSFTEQSLLQFDALHYQTVKDQGYFGVEVAFFPLFPFIWKLLHLSPAGISVFNALVYFVSAFFLFRYLKLSVKEQLVCLLTPGLVFFITPYSEAVFFAAAAIMLIGMDKRKKWLVVSGLLLCAVSRPAFTVLLPALILMECFSQNPDGNWKRILIHVLVTFTGGLIVALVQHFYTGKWFEYFSIQSVWDNSLRVPSLPLRSWGSQSTIMLDGIALLITAASGIVFIFLVIKNRIREVPDILKVSLAYLAGMGLIVLLFRGGSLFSLNRFVFCSPFFFVVAVAFLRGAFRLSTMHIVLVFFLLVCYWLLFGSYVHIQTFLKYAALSLVCLAGLLAKHRQVKTRNVGFSLFVSVLFAAQILFIIRYLDGDWVG